MVAVALAELVGDPAKVGTLPREVVAVVYGPVAGLEAALRVRLLADTKSALPSAPRCSPRSA
jgi:hypothetical protein